MQVLRFVCVTIRTFHVKLNKIPKDCIIKIDIDSHSLDTYYAKNLVLHQPRLKLGLDSGELPIVAK